MIFKTFSSGFALYPDGDKTEQDIFEFIENNEGTRIAQDEIRAEKDKTKQGILKAKTLLTVSFSCNLKERHQKTPLTEKFIEHTGYLILDIDNLALEIIENLKESISENPLTNAVWITCRGKGLAVLVKCSQLKAFGGLEIEHEHKTAIKELISLYEKEFGVPIDPLLDVTRLRFISYDPDLIVNESSKEFEYTKVKKEKAKSKIQNLNGNLDVSTDTKKQICDLARYCVKEKVAILDSHDKRYKGGYILANIFGEKGRVIYHSFIQYLDRYDSDKTDLKYNYFLKTLNKHTSLTKSTLFYIADQKGVNLKALGLSNKPDSKTISEKIDSIDIESFKSASSSDILKSSKRFPNNVYWQLPEQLKKYLSSYSGREKDIMLVHTLGILSGFFTNIRVRYGKDERPALYTYIITSAGVGKGLPDRSKGLIMPYDDKRREYYLENLKSYKIAKAKAKADKDYTFVEDPPRPQKLWSSGNVTGAKLLRDLSDNENVIIATTEADAIANKMSGAHGADLSTFWRMCYHQESPSNETVSDGDIIARDPFLSISILSTANQLPRIIPNLNDGLFSRFSMYGYYDEFQYQNPNLQDHNYNYLDKVNIFSEEIGILNQFPSITVVFTKEQNQQLTQIGKSVTKKVSVLGLNPNTISLITRGVVQHVRIAAILTNLRRLETGEVSEGEVECSTFDFETALDIFQVLLDMNLKFFASLSDIGSSQQQEIKEEHKESTKSISVFDIIPSNFKTSEAIKCFENAGLKKSRAEKILKHWLDTGLIIKDNRFSRGHYAKNDKN
jgi:hypothetical protein